MPWAETPKGVNIYIAAGKVWLTADHKQCSMSFGLLEKSKTETESKTCVSDNHLDCFEKGVQTKKIV